MIAHPVIPSVTVLAADSPAYDTSSGTWTVGTLPGNPGGLNPASRKDLILTVKVQP